MQFSVNALKLFLSLVQSLVISIELLLFFIIRLIEPFFSLVLNADVSNFNDKWHLFLAFLKA